jgi:hypothetical protein
MSIDFEQVLQYIRENVNSTNIWLARNSQSILVTESQKMEVANANTKFGNCYLAVSILKHHPTHDKSTVDFAGITVKKFLKLFVDHHVEECGVKYTRAKMNNDACSEDSIIKSIQRESERTAKEQLDMVVEIQKQVDMLVVLFDPFKNETDEAGDQDQKEV